jgi:hypothetical protein
MAFIISRWQRVLAITALTFGATLAGSTVSPSCANFLYNTTTTYEEWRSRTNCGTNVSCGLTFRKVAAGKTLMITRVSCRFVADQPATVLTNAVLTDATQSRYEYLAPTLLAIDGVNQRHFHIGSDVSAIFIAAMQPEVIVTFDGSVAVSELSCDLTGHYL